MWSQITVPIGNLAWSAAVAALPIAVLFICLAVLKMKGYVAALLGLATGILVAVVVYGMPPQLAFLSTGYGVLNGLFPIGWIVFAAVFLYNLSARSGGFAVVKDSISALTEDRRLQALLIAFCFGAFLEGAAGFGAPVAITAGMLVGLGFEPFYAATICLLSNTAPVAFGGIGIAILTAGKISGIDPALISRMVAHQLPLLAFLVPFWLIVLMSGWSGMLEVWPAVLTVAGAYSVTMYLVASHLGPLLPDILSSLVAMTALILLLQVWRPARVWRFPNEPAAQVTPSKHSLRELVRAWSPYIFLILLVGDWGINEVKALLDKLTVTFAFPGLDKMILIGGKPLAVIYSFGWLSAAGTAIFIAALLSVLVLRISWKDTTAVFGETFKEMSLPLLTIAAVLGFAYLANYSGITATLGKLLTTVGSVFPFFSPFLGWLGVFITGSDTSSNALFCGAQRLTAEQIGVNPVLTVAANSSGGVAAKMISPQSIAVASASVGLVGQEGRLFRATVKHSLAFVAIIGVVTYLQAYYLKAMVPVMASNVFFLASASVVTHPAASTLVLLGIPALVGVIVYLIGRGTDLHPAPAMANDPVQVNE